MMKIVLHLLFVLILTSPVWSSMLQAGHSGGRCHPWSFYNDTLKRCQCYRSPWPKGQGYFDAYTHHDFAVQCSESKVLLNVIFCMTHEKKGTFIAACHIDIFNPNTTLVDGMYIQLPDNITELNTFMCNPMSRRGRVCSECIDGFAPSVTSIGNQCSSCSGFWYGIPLYLFLEFVPSTIFYLLVVVFQISLTTSPMTYCVMYSQMAFYFVSRSTMMSFLRSNR